ncbi:hypothetical protein ACI7YT_12475 [Microbacterium sp. M]|uniref:hypothetical protein n=1 Tax=Microbacterium sp. M TaxID=3377125 RepID=UPI00386A1ECF
MQFSSRLPFNDDPYPNVWEGHSERNQMRADTDMFRRGAPHNRETYRHRPRPEFDRPQSNPTNRLLACARRAHEDGYLDAFCEGFLEQRNTEHPEVDHAQRVLTRLTRLNTAE